MKINQFISAILLGAIMFGSAQAQIVATPKKVVGYLPTWIGSFPTYLTDNNIDLSVLTHIDIAFVNPDETGAIAVPEGLSTIIATAHGKNVKVLLSIGGAGAPTAEYKAIFSNPTVMATFVDNLSNAVTENNLDGIDVDIEGDLLDGKTITAAQYQTFVTNLGSALRAKNKLMTAALASWFVRYVTNTAAQQFDFIGLMSYDATGSWTGPGAHSPYSLMVSDFSTWKAKVTSPDKLVLGVPFYGYGWGENAGSYSYAQIMDAFPGAELVDQQSSGANLISYNGIPTMKKKADYAKANAGGIMIWELSQDVNGANSLLKVIGDVFGRNGAAAVLKKSNSNGSLVIQQNLGNSLTYTLPKTFNNTSLITITNALGVVEMSQISGAPAGTLNTQNLGAGLHFFKATSGNQLNVQSFVISH